MTAFGQYEDDDSGSTCSTRDYKDATGLVVQPVTPTSSVVCATGHRTHALTRRSDSSEDGPGRGTPIVPHAVLPFDTTQITSPSNYSRPKAGDPCHPLAAGAHAPAIAFHPTQDPISSVEVTHALGTGSKGGCATYLATTNVTGTLGARASSGGGFSTDFEVAGGLQPTLTMAVRRLLPVECERLQGFPDDHTNIPWRGKPAPDGPRYKAMGNSMAAVVTEIVAALTASGRGVERTGESRGQDPVVAYTEPTMAVRRLLPVECERLQGFPDDWTNIPWRGKPAPDGPRYKSMGNSMAVPVMRWIGERLDRVAKGDL